MSSELGVPAGVSRDVTGDRGPFAPGLLRRTTLVLVRHPVGNARPRRVVALREADGMAHPAIPEVCPPGEGMAVPSTCPGEASGQDRRNGQLRARI